METGLVRQRNINEEMRDAYLDYAMSVIVSRALPDARDGLKPVHRRILYAMHNMGSTATSEYRKSARIVGEVLGKYHPHGDVSVYEAMVRMAQDFSMRYELVDGQGNFGSIDGDAAAAMRYTEARMAALGTRLLDDIGKNTVDFTDNFDGSLQEPIVLPASLPNLLVNGSSGIAVGMSTSIPPHNLGEVCDAIMYMLDNWEQLNDISVTDLMQFIKGPDFPTGGLIYNKSRDDDEDMLVSAYATGRGKVIVRAKVHLEELGRGRSRIIVTEIPFQINKNALLERIAELAQTGKVEGMADLRDESDRQGLRIVIEVSRAADPADVLAELFKYTPLQSTFSIIMLALVDGEPRTLTLKQSLRIFIEHRLDVIRRRSEYDLAQAEARAHIVQGLLIALDDIDHVIEVIRKSRTPETARRNLRETFKLSEAQATAILDMRLRRLAQLERKLLKDEYDALVKLIQDLRMLLSSAKLMRVEVKRELLDLRKEYADHRRTVIVGDAPTNVRAGDLLVPQEATYVTLTQMGRLSRTFQHELAPIPANADDYPALVVSATTADTLYLFTPEGLVATLPVSQLPQAAEPAVGEFFYRLSALKESHTVVSMLSLPPTVNEGYAFFSTYHGEVKRLRLEDLPGMRADSFSVFDVEAGDHLIRVDVVEDDDEMVLVTHEAQAIRFKVDEVRPTGLAAGGMRGIKLRSEEDFVAGAGVARPGKQVLVLAIDGRGKRTELEEYPVQGRAGGGVRTYKGLKGQESLLAGAAVIEPGMMSIISTTHGRTVLVDTNKAPLYKRDFRGELFFSPGIGEHISGLGLVEPPITKKAVNVPSVENADMIEDNGFVSESPEPAMLGLFDEAEFGDNGDNGYEQYPEE
ncbi:MAG: DNA topoisomerase (ATP-hydrolyzing) subunit A [Chloroflexi bacterium]|nr:DNA topoisomerase (ATP-hydrolyzing) subunit A [Chloroflexota bacterium]